MATPGIINVSPNTDGAVSPVRGIAPYWSDALTTLGPISGPRAHVQGVTSARPLDTQPATDSSTRTVFAPGRAATLYSAPAKAGRYVSFPISERAGRPATRARKDTRFLCAGFRARWRRASSASCFTHSRKKAARS